MIPIPGLLVSLAAAATPVPSHLAISYCDAGEHYQFETVTCAIELRNTGDKPVHVSKGEAKFPWDSIDRGTITVPPKGAAYINAKVDLRNDEGVTRRAFRFATDEPGHPYRGSEVHAMVLSVLDQAKPTLDFGVVKLDEKLPDASISLSSREAADFRITAVASKPDWLDVTLDPDGRTVHATLRADVPWGLIHHDQFVKLKINAPQQPQAWVAVNAQVLGDVVPDGNPFQLGMMRTNGKHQFLVRLSSRSGKDFKLGKVDVQGIKGNAKTEACVPAATGCALVRLDVANDQPTGKLEGVLAVELPEYHRTLPVELVGLLLTPDTKIHDLDELLKEASAQGGESKASAAAKPLDLGKAIVDTVRKQEPPPAGNGPLLRWSVAHQEPIYGYVIYRADREGGPFLRVNKDIVRVVEEGDDKSGAYQWRDNSVESGKTYWYRIGLINRNGSRADLTGAQKVVAK